MTKRLKEKKSLPLRVSKIASEQEIIMYFTFKMLYTESNLR